MASRRRPRVVYLVTSSGVGGAEQQVRSLAMAFHRRGWDVGVVSMLPLEPLLADLPTMGIRTESLAMSRGIPDPRALVRLARLLQRWRPDVLHAHMVHANLLARISRLFVRTPVLISTMHNENEGAQWRYVAYRLTDRLSDWTTGVSQGAVEQAITRGAAARSRILLVPNGIRTDDRAADPATREQARTALGLTGQFAWLAAGRLAEAKDYPTMLSAFRIVHETRSDARLLVAGTGPLESAIEEQIEGAGLAGAVTLLGLRSDVPALMQAADGFVLSSSWEGLPMVLLEAAASGLPIVATDVGGSRDAVLDGTSGFIVPPGDAAALAREMQAVMSMSHGEREAMSAAAREHVAAMFDLDVVVERWEALYRGRAPERLGPRGQWSEGDR